MTDHHLLNDLELQALLKNSDEAAFRTLYDRYWDRLYVMARKRLGDAQKRKRSYRIFFATSGGGDR